jgi:hypothetical protein
MRTMMKEAGIIVGQEKMGGGTERDTFTITAEPAKPTKGA